MFRHPPLLTEGHLGERTNNTLGFQWGLERGLRVSLLYPGLVTGVSPSSHPIPNLSLETKGEVDPLTVEKTRRHGGREIPLGLTRKPSFPLPNSFRLKSLKRFGPNSSCLGCPNLTTKLSRRLPDRRRENKEGLRTRDGSITYCFPRESRRHLSDNMFPSSAPCLTVVERSNPTTQFLSTVRKN